MRNKSIDELQLLGLKNGMSNSIYGGQNYNPLVETVTQNNQAFTVVELLNRDAKVAKDENVELSRYNMELPICKIESLSETNLVALAKECGKQKLVVGERGNKLRINKKLKRLTKSKFKFKVEPIEVKVNGLEAIDSEMVSKVDVEMITEGSALTPPKRNLELKMSKKIVLDNVPMTVKELFEIGLLEGVPVVYMGGKKV